MATGARAATPFPVPARDVLHLVPSPRAVPESRSWIGQKMADAGAGEDDVFVAELLTSELVTNAVRLGAAAGEITVRADLRDSGLVTVAVSDQSDETPTVRRAEPDDLGGRGLQIVEACSRQWGVEPLGRGKSVWFELAFSARVLG